MTESNGQGWMPDETTTLTSDQEACVRLLQMTLAEAEKGTFHALCIVVVTSDGFGSQICGSNAPATYMGMGLAMKELEEMVKPSKPVQRLRPTILRPGMQS